MIPLPPPDEIKATKAKRYGVPRGTCPACGSGDVEHLIIGLQPVSLEQGMEPDWVISVGCVDEGFDRHCRACNSVWES